MIKITRDSVNHMIEIDNDNDLETIEAIFQLANLKFYSIDESKDITKAILKVLKRNKGTILSLPYNIETIKTLESILQRSGLNEPVK